MYFLTVSVLLLFAANVHGITQITCQEGTMEIICGRDTVIHIISANYGRKSATVCSDNGVPTIDTNCSAENALHIVRDKCEGNQSCLVIASTCLFGDPCYGTFKYLQVDYECVPDAKFDYGLACAHTDLTISCGLHETINIIRANYGRETESICPNSAIVTTYCLNKNSTQIASNLCNDKQTCTMNAGPETFGDPCFGTNKYLWVKYECLKDFQCYDGRYLPRKKVCDGNCDCPRIIFPYYFCDDELNCPLNAKLKICPN